MSVDLVAAHAHSSDHRVQVLASKACGCFYCRRTFSPEEIGEWIDDDQTALCPKCGIDSVIGDRSGYQLSDEFLRAMRARWFS